MKSREVQLEAFAHYSILGLTVGHLATAVYWIQYNSYSLFDKLNSTPSCYPFIQNCHKINFKHPETVFTLYLLLTVATLIFFFKKNIKRKTIYLKVLFTILFLFKISLFLLRYDLSGSFHIIHLTASLVAILSLYGIYRIQTAIFYFTAGLLKLNLEWSSGAAGAPFKNHLVPQPLFLTSLGYVILLELFLVWGICSKSLKIRQLSLLQLIVFHLYSSLMVGWLFPAIMLSLLLPLIYEDLIKKNNIHTLSLKPLNLLLPLLFISWHLSARFEKVKPYFDGNVRYLTIHPYDSNLLCNISLYSLNKDSLESYPIKESLKTPRKACDPITYQVKLQEVCNTNPKSKFIFYLESKLTSSIYFEPIREYKNVCKI